MPCLAACSIPGTCLSAPGVIRVFCEEAEAEGHALQFMFYICLLAVWGWCGGCSPNRQRAFTAGPRYVDLLSGGGGGEIGPSSCSSQRDWTSA